MTTAVLITVREALIRLGWHEPNNKATPPTNARQRLLGLCSAKGITVEQFEEGGQMWISAAQLDAYIASLGVERSDG